MDQEIEFPEPPFSRADVRSLVEAEHEQSMAAHEAGGNAYQVTLDQGSIAAPPALQLEKPPSGLFRPAPTGSSG